LLQEREYERVGETKPRYADVRVIAASNHDLVKDVAAGNFREDLYYRLNVISITLPPLRDRLDDVERLATAHLHSVATQCDKKVDNISADALDALKRYNWPGNIRELRNVIERAVILSNSDKVEASDLVEMIVPSPEIRIGGKVSLEELETAHIKKVIANTKTLEEAAGVLGIDAATLYRKRKRLA
jgi:two-component system, NtrC family, response regulator AlgB